MNITSPAFRSLFTTFTPTFVCPGGTQGSRSLLNMADKFKEVAVGEADHIKTLASDAARSMAYLYPFRVYFLRLSSP